MTASPSSQPVVSRITLALLEDSGCVCVCVSVCVYACCDSNTRYWVITFRLGPLLWRMGGWGWVWCVSTNS